jgi:hypothetical protein
MAKQIFGEPVYDLEETTPLAYGSGDSDMTPDAPERPAGVLWLPDPEQRHGWREHYVWRPAPPIPTRPFGFQTRRRPAPKETTTLC